MGKINLFSHYIIVIVYLLKISKHKIEQIRALLAVDHVVACNCKPDDNWRSNAGPLLFREDTLAFRVALSWVASGAWEWLEHSHFSYLTRSHLIYIF